MDFYGYSKLSEVVILYGVIVKTEDRCSLLSRMLL